MKKKLCFAAIVALVLSCVLLLASCGTTAAAQTVENATEPGETVYITAYDLAVQQGFVGTLDEWLESLKGSDGKNGENGKDGAAMFTITDVYDAAVEKGYDGTFLEFVKEYLGDTATTSDVTLATNKGLRSAVAVTCTFTVTQYDYWGHSSETQATTGGAGVIYRLDKESGDAYVLTNFHVVYDAGSTSENNFCEDIKLYLYGAPYAESAIPATIVGGSAYYDVAVLKVTGSEILKQSDAIACELAEGEVVVGQYAIAIGFPAAEGISATGGIVSVDSENITLNIEGNNIYSTREFRVDAAINSGNSGGGVYNDEGKLIGLVNARHNNSSSETIENIGYAIPLSIVTGVANNVIDNCNGADKVGVYKCMLGITTTIDDSKMVYDSKTGLTSIVQNVIVADVSEGGLAEGKLEVNDIITSARIGDATYEITRSYHLTDAMLNGRVGDEVVLSIVRNGEATTVSFTLTEESMTLYLTK